MNAIPKNMFIGLVTVFLLPLIGRSQVPERSQSREQILEIARAFDLEDERLNMNWERLKQHSEELFPMWVELIQTSNEDRVLEFSLLTADSASPTQGRELTSLATHLLGRIDPTLFPLATQSALRTIGKSGATSDLPTVQRYLTNPNVLIQSAAKKAIQALADSPAKTPRSTLPLLPRTVQSNSSKQTNPRQDETFINVPVTPIPWGIIIGLIVAAMALLAFLRKRRS